MDGVKLLNTVLEMVVPALVRLTQQPKDDGYTLKACENAAATLAGIATTDEGIYSCLTHQVPKAIVSLVNRGISGEA